METQRALRKLTLVASTMLAVGVVLVFAGIVARDAASDIRTMFATGKWSVHVVQDKTGIHSKADIRTENERTLFGCLGATNEECVAMAELCAGASLVACIIGVWLLLSGFTIMRTLQKLKTQNMQVEHISNSADAV